MFFQHYRIPKPKSSSNEDEKLWIKSRDKMAESFYTVTFYVVSRYLLYISRV